MVDFKGFPNGFSIKLILKSKFATKVKSANLRDFLSSRKFLTAKYSFVIIIDFISGFAT